MIYRLATGTQSGWRKHLVSGALIFMLTAGFPVLAAWVNYERFNLSPDPVVQQDDDGQVLGENTTTENPGDSSTESSPTAVSREMPVQRAPQSRPIRVQHNQTVTPAPPVPVPAPTPAPPIDLPITDAEPTEEDDPPLEVDVLDTIEVDVTPPSL